MLLSAGRFDLSEEVQASSTAAQFLEQRKEVRFQLTHNQGLHQLFLTVSWDLRT